MNSNVHKIVNAVLFQALWFSAVLYGWRAAALPLILLLGHLLSLRSIRHSLAPCLALACFGMIGDSVLAAMSVYQFPSDQTVLATGLPVWLIFMWLGFAATVPLSLSWVFQSRWLVLGLFAVGGPLSYSAGRALGAINFDNENAMYVVVLWGLMGLIALGLSRYSSERAIVGNHETVLDSRP